MKDSDTQKLKDKEPKIDLSQFSKDDIAKRFLETPPKPKKKEKDKS